MNVQLQCWGRFQFCWIDLPQTDLFFCTKTVWQSRSWHLTHVFFYVTIKRGATWNGKKPATLLRCVRPVNFHLSQPLAFPMPAGGVVQYLIYCAARLSAIRYIDHMKLEGWQANLIAMCWVPPQQKELQGMHVAQAAHADDIRIVLFLHDRGRPVHCEW